MKWYVVKIVFQIITGDVNFSKQFDEHLRLILANNEFMAFNKATTIGKEEQEIFLNNRQQLVQWKFINVAELYELGGLADGMELYSRIQEYEEPLNYMDSINKRALHIRQRSERTIEELI